MEEESEKLLEYAKFIEITRKHQAEREKQKTLVSVKKTQPNEEYYIDISQLDTLIQDNLAKTPQKDVDADHKDQREKLAKLYGGRDAYERIRSMEMNIDEHFREKCKEHSPYYWPVIPINPRPYLNPIRK